MIKGGEGICKDINVIMEIKIRRSQSKYIKKWIVRKVFLDLIDIEKNCQSR